MPGSLGGTEVLAELRKADPFLPVFVASGYADDPIMASPTSHGFTASIRKPFRRQELAEFLERHLERAEEVDQFRLCAGYRGTPACRWSDRSTAMRRVPSAC